MWSCPFRLTQVQMACLLASSNIYSTNTAWKYDWQGKYRCNIHGHTISFTKSPDASHLINSPNIFAAMKFFLFIFFRGSHTNPYSTTITRDIKKKIKQKAICRNSGVISDSVGVHAGFEFATIVFFFKEWRRPQSCLFEWVHCSTR